MEKFDSIASGLIWGFDFGAVGTSHPVHEPGATLDAGEPGVFRWLHVNLADQWAIRRINGAIELSEAARALLQSTDRHPRALVVDGQVAGLIPDFERDFDDHVLARTGALYFALTNQLMITGRTHPLCAADMVHRRIREGAHPRSPAAALDLLISSVAEVCGGVAKELNATVQASEDALLNDGRIPDGRALLKVRRRSVQLHRQLNGLRGILTRLEADDDLPDGLEPAIARQSQRIAALDSDVMVLQANLRQLRDELDVQTANRTNQNLYVLSMLTALLMPATLVTGFFGMNTGNMLWQDDQGGTLKALLVALISATAVYLWLRSRGFFRN